MKIAAGIFLGSLVFALSPLGWAKSTTSSSTSVASHNSQTGSVEAQAAKGGDFTGKIEVSYFRSMDLDGIPSWYLHPDLGVHIYENYFVGTDLEFKSALEMEFNDKKAGWSDVKIYVGTNDLLNQQDKDFAVKSRINGIIPTSVKSQDVTLLGGASWEIGLSKKLGSLFTLGFSNEFITYNYEFDSVEKDGDNVPFGMKNKISLTTKIFGSLKWKNEFKLNTNQSYNGRTENAYDMASSLDYGINKTYSAALTMKYKNKKLESYELEDPINYSVFAGLVISL